MDKPFLPRDRAPADILKHWRRSAAITALAALRGATRDEVAFGAWRDEPGAAEMAVKGSVSPLSDATVAGNTLISQPVLAFLQSLAPESAAARLFATCARFSLDGAGMASLPRFAATFPEAVFVGEGAPIPAMTGTFENVYLGPQRKLAAIVGLTNELAQHSAESATTILDLAMREAAARALDAAVFSASAASSIAPAGLLAGVTPIAKATGGGADAMVKDLSGLAGAIGDAGGGTGILYFANPRQATAIELRAEKFAEKVVPTAKLAAGTVVAIETAGIASAFDGLPKVDVGKETVIHWEDTAPQPIASPGTPNVVAAPVRSGYQTDVMALRLILRCAWASRMAGAVQMVTGTTW